jgi:hypothetical protein
MDNDNETIEVLAALLEMLSETNDCVRSVVDSDRELPGNPELLVKVRDSIDNYMGSVLEEVRHTLN